MEIAIKNVKHAVFMSQETECFEASVYINGKKAGTVSNAGHGGCNDYHPWDLYQTLQAHCDTIPPDMAGYRVTPDEIIGNLFETWYNKKQYTKLCKGQTLFRIPGKEYGEGQWNVAKIPFSPEVRSRLVSQFGASVEILNERV